jgi:hypothetical protein
MRYQAALVLDSDPVRDELHPRGAGIVPDILRRMLLHHLELVQQKGSIRVFAGPSAMDAGGDKTESDRWVEAKPEASRRAPGPAGLPKLLLTYLEAQR